MWEVRIRAYPASRVTQCGHQHISRSFGQCEARVVFKTFSFVAVFSRMQQKLFSTATLRCSSETASVAFESLQSSGVGSSAQNMFLLLSWWWRSCCTARTFMMSVDSSASTKHFLNTCSSTNSFYSDVWKVWCFQPQYVVSVVVEHSTHFDKHMISSCWTDRQPFIFVF